MRGTRCGNLSPAQINPTFSHTSGFFCLQIYIAGLLFRFEGIENRMTKFENISVLSSAAVKAAGGLSLPVFLLNISLILSLILIIGL